MPDRTLTHGRAAALSLVSLGAVAHAQPPDRDVVPFAVTHQVGFGESVYVLGDLPELGGGDLTQAVKMDVSDYPTWRIDVSLPVNRSFEYTLVVRADGPDEVGDTTNAAPLAAGLPGATATAALSPPSKTVIVQGVFDQPELWFRQPPGGGAWTPVEMWDIGPGRTDAERRWVARDVGVSGCAFEFYVEERRPTRPAVTIHETSLDRVLLRDGELFSYEPADTVSPPRKDYDPASPPKIYSGVLGQNRRYRVALPRGYDEHTHKRYPVIYMHDGQNVFDMGTFGTWDADETAERLVREGAMRECIIVGVDSSTTRIWDYITPDDIVPMGVGAGEPGRADLYAQFLIHELKPVIDSAYRTLGDADHTAAVGSSLGAVASLYLGWDFGDWFGRVGAMSGSWWLPGFPARIEAEPRRDVRVYLDVGTAGSSNDGYDGSVDMRDRLVRKGAVIEGDLRFRVGVGDEHIEAAWARRLPWCFEFLFPARGAPDGLGHIVTARRADVDDDGLETLDDLYAFDARSGPNLDVDRDGAPATEADRAELVRLLRLGEAADVLALRLPD